MTNSSTPTLSCMLSTRSPRFTLVELLVVITIIAILAAMLLPGLARARYSARLVACANLQHQYALALMHYASDNDRTWPKRHNKDSNAQPYVLKGHRFDDRPHQREYFTNDFQCPIQPAQIDHWGSTQGAVVSSYSIFAGWTIASSGSGSTTPTSGTTSMKRLADNFEYNDNEYNILLSSKSVVYIGTLVQETHPDYGTGVLSPFSNTGIAETHYRFNQGHARGPVDQVYTRNDGSTFRINRVSFDDHRLTLVPYKSHYHNTASRRMQLPSIDYQ